MTRALKSVLTIFLGTLLLIPIAFAGMKACGRSPMPLIDKTINGLPIQLTSTIGLRTRAPVVIGNWPPVPGERFPDLILSDQSGDTMRLSDFEGKILLIEYAAIPCAGCQAFAGGKTFGGYGGFQVQPQLESVEHYAKQIAGVTLGSKDVVFVQVLLYGKGMSSPTQAEVRGWAKHFEMDRNQNKVVLRGDPSMLSQETYEMIPGFQLVDRDFVLRSDSCGHYPKDNLYQDLLPTLRRLAGH